MKSKRAEPRWLWTCWPNNPTPSAYAYHWVICYMKECQLKQVPILHLQRRHGMSYYAHTLFRSFYATIYFWTQHATHHLLSSSGGERVGKLVKDTLCPQLPLFWQRLHEDSEWSVTQWPWASGEVSWEGGKSIQPHCLNPYCMSDTLCGSPHYHSRLISLHLHFIRLLLSWSKARQLHLLLF